MASNLGTPSSNQGHSVTASTTHTVSSGSNRVSYIGVFANAETPINTMANFGGVAPALVGTYNALHLYRVVNPSVGSTTAQANLAADVLWSIHVITLQDVDQADPDDSPVTATEIETTSVSTAAITSAVNDLVVAFGLMVYSDIGAFAGATLSSEQESIDTGFTSTAMVYEAGASSVVVGVSSSTPSLGDNHIIAVNVRHSGGGGGGGPGPNAPLARKFGPQGFQRTIVNM